MFYRQDMMRFITLQKRDNFIEKNDELRAENLFTFFPAGQRIVNVVPDALFSVEYF